MRKIMAVGIVVGLSASLSHGALAEPPKFVPEAARNVAGGSAVEVIVPQYEINAEINPSGFDGMKGLLPELIADAQDESRRKKADGFIAPVRQGLTGFDIDALALKSTKSGLTNVSWLHPTLINFIKDDYLPSESSGLKDLDKKNASQTLFIKYRYGFTADFSAVELITTIFLTQKAMPLKEANPEARLHPMNIVFSNTMYSFVYLPHPSFKDHAGNAAQWAANGARPTREALAMAFAELEKLLPRTLMQTENDIKTMDSKPRKWIFRVFARMQEQNHDDTILWAYYGFQSVQQIH